MAHAPLDSPTAGPSVGPGRRRNAVLRAVGLIAVVVAWLAIAGLGGPAIGSLSTVQSNDQESFLPAGAESVQAATAAAQFDDSGAAAGLRDLRDLRRRSDSRAAGRLAGVHPVAGRRSRSTRPSRSWAPSATTWSPARSPASRCRSR